jgi:riboflavin kinase/FMN adenylyltransferase
VIKGIVVEGNKKGREHGFSTANILNSENLSTGIYAAKVFFAEKIYPAAAYVGTPKPEVLEVHLLDFAGDLYGKEIEVLIVKKIREDFHEPDEAKLKAMIENDVKKIRLCLLES